MVDADVRVEILRHFLKKGHAPTHNDVATTLDMNVDDAAAAFRRLHDAHTIVLAPGSPYIWMANPFSAIATDFKVSTDSQEWWGNCVWDALGIVALLGRDADVAARCPDCGETLNLYVRGGEVLHRDEIVHYSIPAARWWEDIGAT